MYRSYFLLLLALMLTYPNPLPANDQLFADTLQLAEQGDQEAQFSLGVMYDTGNLVKRDSEQATHWFKKAASAGVTGACLYLGMKYEFGAGVNQDREKAQHWYRKAAIRGWPQASFLLGNLYLSSATTNQVQGCAWLKIAMERGYPVAEEAWQQECSDLNEAISQKTNQLKKRLNKQIYSPDTTSVTD